MENMFLTGSPVKEDNKIFIRTVTHYYTGVVTAFNEKEILLKDAAWIADTGRFGQAIANGTFDEVEVYPDDMIVSVSRDAIVDVCEWKHDLPRQTK